MNSKSVRETKTEVNTFDSNPKNKVVANPRIGPVPNWNRNAAAMIDETCVLFDSIFVSGGRRGLDIEIAPDDLISVLGAVTAPIGTSSV